MSAALPTSACTPMTRALADFLSAATASSSDSLPRARIATSAPEAAKRVATASPMPLLPPVTMAERPCKLISMKLSRTPPERGRARLLGAGSGDNRLARHDAMDRLAGRLAHRLVVEQHGRAAKRAADQCIIEGGVEPSRPIAKIGARGDAPAHIQNAVRFQQCEQTPHRRR